MATGQPWRRSSSYRAARARWGGDRCRRGAGTCRVRLRNNVVIAARGTAVPAGQMAFISDGMVTSRRRSSPPVRYRGLIEPIRPACRPGTAGGRTRVSKVSGSREIHQPSRKS